MATLTTIEFLLSLEESAEIELYEIPIEKVKEFSRLYNTKIHEVKLNRWTTIENKKIKIRLNTEKKIPINYGF
jgi:hypothetical protein